MAALIQSIFTASALLGHSRIPSPIKCVATAPSTSSDFLSAISAAPSTSTASFDLAEALCTDGSLPHGPWRHAFRALVTDETFLQHGWARAPFKLEEQWSFAVGAYTMADVARDITLLPPQFVAHGVEANGGIYNKPFSEGFTFSDVDAAMDGATVVMLNAGFLVPKLARVSLAMLEATQLPIWTNVYLSKPGLKRSTQRHTDKQDVLLVQCTGRKRWRVFKPPPPSDTPQHDPFARGKGTDTMADRPQDLLIDTVMSPGQVLYIPAGFPHDTDTVGEAETETSLAAASEPSVHLTVGIDTHLWGLSYSKLREVALSRAREAPTLPGGLPLTSLPLPAWSRLHQPLPLGFLSAPILAPLCVGGRAAAVGLDDAKRALSSAIALDLARRMVDAEPDRWGGDDADAVADGGEAAEAAAKALVEDERLGLCDAAERLISHHQSVLGVQATMYRRAADPPPGSSSSAEAAVGDGVAVPRTAEHVMDGLMSQMDLLDAHMGSLDGWGRGVEAPVVAAPVAAAPEAATSKAKAGFGGAAKGGAAAKKPKGGKKKRK